MKHQCYLRLLCFAVCVFQCTSFTSNVVVVSCRDSGGCRPRPFLTHHLNDVNPALIVGGVIAAGGGAWLYLDGAEDRAWRQRRLDEDARYQANQQERAAKAHVEPKEYWDEAELAAYDGTQDEDQGPILLAADGLVFNVYKGRNFYGPGGEYHLFAGRDATRFLAKTIVEEETPEQASQPLTMAERAALAAWMFTIKSKYEVVGKLRGFDPTTTSMTSTKRNK